MDGFSSTDGEGSPATTYTRANAGTVYAPDGTTVANGQARYAKGKFGQALWMEEGTTNLLTNPILATTTSWNPTSGASLTTVYTSPNDGALPWRTASCTQLTRTTSNGYIWQSVTLTTGIAYSFSAWVYVPSTVTAVVNFQMWINPGTWSGVSGGSKPITERDQWVYKTLSFTSGATATHIISVGLVGGSTGESIYVCFAQLEQKTLPTTFVDGIRSDDYMYISTDNGVYSNTAGTIDCWVYVTANNKSRATNVYPGIFAVRGASNERILDLYHRQTTENTYTLLAQASTTNTFADSVVSSNAWHHFAVVWDATSSRCYIDGVLRGTSSPVPTGTPYRIYIGNAVSLGPLDGLIDSFRVSNAVRTPTELLTYANLNQPMVWDATTTALYHFNGTSTLRFCCQPSYSGGNVNWTPAIIDPGLYQVNLFSGGRLTGASSYSYGEVVLNNLKNVDTLAGPLDYLKNYNFYGRSVRLYTGLESASFPAGFTQQYSAAIEGMSIGVDTISFTLRGRQAELDIPINKETNKFLGSSVLPDGLEGQTALKDKIKPILIGRALNFTPVLCNSSKLIYAVSPLTGLSIDQFGSDIHVYDNGVELAFGGNFGNLETNAPSPGFFNASDVGYIRLGANPVGTVTCTAVTKDLGLRSHPAKLIDLILNKAGKTSMTDGSSYTNFTDKGERGIYLTSETNISTLIDQLVAPFGFWYFSKTGFLRLGVLEAPENIPDNRVSFYLNSQTNIVSFSTKKTQDTKGGVPAKRVKIKYSKNYTIQELQTNTDPDWKFRVNKDNEYLESLTPISPIVHPFSEELEMVTACSSIQPNTPTLLSVLFQTNRELIEVEIIASDFLTACNLLPGQCVHVDLHGRFGMVSVNPKHMLITGILLNFVDESVKLILWG